MTRSPLLKLALVLATTLALCGCISPPPLLDEATAEEARSAYRWYLLVTTGMSQSDAVDHTILESIATAEFAADSALHLQQTIDAGAMIDTSPTIERFDLVAPPVGTDVAAPVCAEVSGDSLVDRATGVPIDLGDPELGREAIVTFVRDDDELLITGRTVVPERERTCP